MARYRKIDVRIHGDEKFRRLSSPQPCGKYLWFYLLTTKRSTSLPGLFEAGEMSLAEEIGWPLEGFRKAFQELSREGLAKANWEARVVWLPKVIRYNRPESVNVVKGWAKHWDEVPECDLKNEAYSTLMSELKALGEAFAEAFRKGCPKPMPNQEQEQEQEPILLAPCPKPVLVAPVAPTPPRLVESGRNVAAEASAILVNPHLALAKEPHQWPEVVDPLRALAEADGKVPPRIGHYSGDKAVQVLVGHLAAGWEPAELVRLYREIPTGEWWRGLKESGKSPGASWLSPEVLRRHADARESKPKSKPKHFAL